jgi:molecular chaperone GrpE
MSKGKEIDRTEDDNPRFEEASSCDDSTQESVVPGDEPGEASASEEVEGQLSAKSTVEELPNPQYVKELEIKLSLAQYKIKELEERLSSYESKFADIREYVKKMEGEIKEIQKRAERDTDKVVSTKLSKVFEVLLPVIDNFELSVKSMGDESSTLADGIRMIYLQLQEVLGRAELIKIATTGEKFDPNLHEAVLVRPVEKKSDDGLILEEIKAGYQYQDRVVRPAQVIVGQKNDQAH